MAPSEFWRMTPAEWWRIYECKRPKDPENDYAGNLNDTALEEISEIIADAKRRKEQHG